MKLIDQNNQPINDPSTLPIVEPEGGTIPLVLTTKDRPGTPEVIGTTADDEAAAGAADDDEADPKLNRRDYFIKRLRRMQERIHGYERQTAGQLSLTLMSTAASLGLAIDLAAALPDDWKPVQTSAPSAELAVGSRVVIRARFRKIYQDDLSEAQMDDLVVDRVGEKRLRCKTSGGELVLIPSGHVDLV